MPRQHSSGGKQNLLGISKRGDTYLRTLLIHGARSVIYRAGLLKTKTVGAKATPEGIEVTFSAAEEGVKVPEPQTYDLVLQAVGRTPNGKKIAADKAGVAVTERGFINVDIQMRTNVPHIFAIGDIVGQPMLAHKAVHEALVAAEVIAGELQGNKELAAAAFNARVIPSVAYTDPEVAWVGLTEDSGLAPKASRSRRACSPGPPGESIGMAAEIAHSSCTDVPPAKK